MTNGQIQRRNLRFADHVRKRGVDHRARVLPLRVREQEDLLARFAEVVEHRHRFEVNNAYRAQLEEKGLAFSGLSPDGELVEMVEIPVHPHFVACQFHPEFLSRPWRAHPLFSSLVQAGLKAK